MPITLRDLAPFMTPYVSAEDRALSSARTFGTISGAMNTRRQQEIERQQLAQRTQHDLATQKHWQRSDQLAQDVEKNKLESERQRIEREERDKDLSLVDAFYRSVHDPIENERVKGLMAARGLGLEDDPEEQAQEKQKQVEAAAQGASIALQQAPAQAPAPPPQPAPAAPLAQPPAMPAMPFMPPLQEPPWMNAQPQFMPEVGPPMPPEPVQPYAPPPGSLYGLGPMIPEAPPSMPEMEAPAMQAPAPAPQPAPAVPKPTRRVRITRQGKHIATVDTAQLAEMHERRMRGFTDAAVAAVPPEDREAAELARAVVTSLPFGAPDAAKTFQTYLDQSADRRRQYAQTQATAELARANAAALNQDRGIKNQLAERRENRAELSDQWKRDIAERKLEIQQELADAKAEQFADKKKNAQTAVEERIWGARTREINTAAKNTKATEKLVTQQVLDSGLKTMEDNWGDPQAYARAGRLMVRQMERGATTEGDAASAEAMHSWVDRLVDWASKGITGKTNPDGFADMHRFVESLKQQGVESTKADYQRLAKSMRDSEPKGSVAWNAADRYLQAHYGSSDFWREVREAEGLHLFGKLPSETDAAPTDSPAADASGRLPTTAGTKRPATGVPMVRDALKALDAELQ